MGQDFFVRWEGEKTFELLHRDYLEQKLISGRKPTEIYSAGEEIHSMSFSEDGKIRVKLFMFI